MSAKANGGRTTASNDMILDTLGLPAALTLEYYWEDVHFVPGEIIPNKFLEDDDDMRAALMRLRQATGLVRKAKSGWHIGIDVYEAVQEMTQEQAERLYRSEMIRQLFAGAMERYGVVTAKMIAELRRAHGVSEQEWQAVRACWSDAELRMLSNGDGEILCHPVLENPEDILHAWQLNGLSACTMDADALRLSAEWLSGNASVHLPAMDWLSRIGASPEDAAYILKSASLAMQGSCDAEDFLNDLCETLETDSLPEDARHMLVDLAERVPLWQYRGASIREMNAMQREG